jgi:peroxiredoxin Q/BCP
MKSTQLLMPLAFMMAGLNAHEPALDRTPRTGELAQDFELRTLDGASVKLSILTEKGPVALIVLRGYPGAQSDVCSRQVADLINKASGFMDAGATVILVYPGTADKLDMRAREFLADKMLPNNFRFVTDPDFVFTNKYGLRWDAKNETAYPATFVMNAKGLVTYALVSKTHGGRAKTEDLLKALSIK